MTSMATWRVVLSNGERETETFPESATTETVRNWFEKAGDHRVVSIEKLPRSDWEDLFN